MSKVDALFDEIQQEINQVKYDFLDEVFGNLIRATPYKHGIARKSWQIVVNYSELDYYEPIPYEEDYETYYYFGQETYDLDFPEMQGPNPYIEPVPEFIQEESEIHIANTIDYIQDLNLGSSPQASSFFIEATVLDAIEKIK